MARLIINPGSASAWEVELKPGVNCIGRGSGNDVQVPDPSVSTSHCQILVSATGATLKDLDSTNGTFVNRTLVREAALQTGQTIQFGGAIAQFYSDTPTAAPLPLPPVSSGAAGAVVQPQPAPLVTSPARVPLPAQEAAGPAMQVGEGSAMRASHYCKFHPKIPARQYCEKCKECFCESCVGIRIVGGTPHKQCRHCGSECRPLQVTFTAVVEQGFFERLPGALAYPLRGAGIFVIVVGAVLLGMVYLGTVMLRVGGIRNMLFGIVMETAAIGYLFTYVTQRRALAWFRR